MKTLLKHLILFALLLHQGSWAIGQDKEFSNNSIFFHHQDNVDQNEVMQIEWTSLIGFNSLSIYLVKEGKVIAEVARIESSEITHLNWQLPEFLDAGDGYYLRGFADGKMFISNIFSIKPVAFKTADWFTMPVKFTHISAGIGMALQQKLKGAGYSRVHSFGKDCTPASVVDISLQFKTSKRTSVGAFFTFISTQVVGKASYKWKDGYIPILYELIGRTPYQSYTTTYKSYFNSQQYSFGPFLRVNNWLRLAPTLNMHSIAFKEGRSNKTVISKSAFDFGFNCGVSIPLKSGFTFDAVYSYSGLVDVSWMAVNENNANKEDKVHSQNFNIGLTYYLFKPKSK